jgi:hypothetical protein
MTGFRLDIAGWKPVVAIVAAHGASDLSTYEWFPHYLGSLLMPLPPRAVTALFCAASLVHFGEDGGNGTVSVAVHALVALIGMRRGKDAAFRAMLAYLVTWHLPQHYLRHLRNGRRRGVAIASMATALGLLFSRHLPDQLVLTDWMQRLVVAHISREMSLLWGD